MKKTKNKIFDAAIHLFNKDGLPNVKLQNIADFCDISVGNLAYHYRTKDLLLTTIDQHIQSELKSLTPGESSFPYLIDFDNQLSNYFHFINKFAFYFLDILQLERSYPALHEHRVDSIGQLIDQIHSWMIQNIEKGIFQSEILPGQYEKTAHLIWMNISFWMTQQKVLGKKDSEEGLFKEQIWSQLVPLFTANGMLEFEAIILPQLQHFSNAKTYRVPLI